MSWGAPIRGSENPVEASPSFGIRFPGAHNRRTNCRCSPMKPVSQMQAKDIPDDVFLEAVLDTPYGGPGPWRFRDDVQKTLEGMLGYRLPEKLFLAKARKLGRQQKLGGCTDCTCRGDYHLPFECYLARCCYLPDYDWTQHPAYMPEWETIAARFRAK